jgi:DNA repair photolyase
MNSSSCDDHTATNGVPAPGFVRRIGEIVDRRRKVEFQELRSVSLVNRLAGAGMPFGFTVNPYRGCEFGCRYCYARPTHEYLGHSRPEEFEDRIYIKRSDQHRLLADLRRARASGQEVAIGAATDPYQPAEGRFQITRAVLAAMAQVPGLRVGITTKSPAVARDLDLLGAIARHSELHVNVSVISLEADLVRVIEPRAPRPDLRLRAVRVLSDAGLRTRLFVMPVLPMITDADVNLDALLRAGRSAGAREAIANVLFLRTPMVWAFFLRFVGEEFPWALGRYRQLYPRPGAAPREYREAIEQRVEALARAVGFPARSRDERIRDEAPPRTRQLSLVW